MRGKAIMSDDHSADIYVSGLSHIELIGGGCARFVCYVVKTDADGKAVREPRTSLIMPLDMVPDAVEKTLKATTGEVRKKAGAVH